MLESENSWVWDVLLVAVASFNAVSSTPNGWRMARPPLQQELDVPLRVVSGVSESSSSTGFTLSPWTLDL